MPKKISQKISDFHAEIDGSVDYLSTDGNGARVGLITARMDSIIARRAEIDAAFNLYVNPLKQTSAVILDMETKFKRAHTEWASIQQMIKNNMDVELTAEDISALHIHIDHPSHHVIPALEFCPGNVVTKQAHLVTRIFTLNPTEGHSSDKFKPPGAGKIGRKIAFVKPGDPAPAAADYETMDAIGAVQYNLIFNPEDVNKQAYFITWYISPTGEASPESLPIVFSVI